MINTVKYGYAREKKQNPYVGFTSFQHFRNDALYSDLIVRPENNMTETEHVECYPVPDYVEEKGREQGYYPDCSVVYIRILWKEFEPREGEFNYAFIEDILQKARENDQTVMFRLMQHSTRETDDVPDWLKEKIECPARPIGKRVKECPSDPDFLVYFGRAVKAFGDRFDSDPTLAFMDISLPGSWGEGSHIDLFTQDQVKTFADIYTSSFKNTLLIGQARPSWLMEHFWKSAPIGWRADCIGQRDAYENLKPHAEAMGDAWKRGHISFESYWWLGEWQRKGWDEDWYFQRMLDWHVSTFNAKSIPIPFEWKDKIDAFVAKMGYHFTIREAKISDSVKAGEKLSLSLKIENVGVAPIYMNLPLYVRLKNGSEEFTFKTDANIQGWLPGEHNEAFEIPVPSDLSEGEYELQIGIGGGDTPSVCFATDAPCDGDFAVLARVIINEQ